MRSLQNSVTIRGLTGGTSPRSAPHAYAEVPLCQPCRVITVLENGVRTDKTSSRLEFPPAGLATRRVFCPSTGWGDDERVWRRIPRPAARWGGLAARHRRACSRRRHWICGAVHGPGAPWRARPARVQVGVSSAAWGEERGRVWRRPPADDGRGAKRGGNRSPTPSTRTEMRAPAGALRGGSPSPSGRSPRVPRRSRR